jgi:predicted MFS family arabinose efflux permease
LIVASLLLLVAGDRWRLVWWLFAAVGLLAAAVNVRVLSAAGSRPTSGPMGGRSQPRLRSLFHARSAPLFGVTFAASVTSGGYFAYAPDTVQAAGLAAWTGPAMWAVLGIAGTAVGVFGGALADRFGLRRSLVATALLIAVSTVMLLVPAWPLATALVSAALFGVGFTTAFAFLVMWSQEVFHAHPTSGFTVTIVCAAAGFSVGPAVFGILATHVGRSMAVLGVAVSAVIAAMVSARHPTGN